MIEDCSFTVTGVFVPAGTPAGVVARVVVRSSAPLASSATNVPPEAMTAARMEAPRTVPMPTARRGAGGAGATGAAGWYQEDVAGSGGVDQTGPPYSGRLQSGRGSGAGDYRLGLAGSELQATGDGCLGAGSEGQPAGVGLGAAGSELQAVGAGAIGVASETEASLVAGRVGGVGTVAASSGAAGLSAGRSDGRSV
jgi:hypothetical protein